jgi:hypothetical protein
MAALALLFATVMVNAAPENPYLHNIARSLAIGPVPQLQRPHALVCSLWPFLALPWLMIYRPEKTHARHD